MLCRCGVVNADHTNAIYHEVSFHVGRHHTVTLKYSCHSMHVDANEISYQYSWEATVRMSGRVQKGWCRGVG